MTRAERFQKWLERNGACAEARAWCRGKTFSVAWKHCGKGQWLLWFLRQFDPSREPTKNTAVLEVRNRWMLSNGTSDFSALSEELATVVRREFGSTVKGWQP